MPCPNQESHGIRDKNNTRAMANILMGGIYSLLVDDNQALGLLGVDNIDSMREATR